VARCRAGRVNRAHSRSARLATSSEMSGTATSGWSVPVAESVDERLLYQVVGQMPVAAEQVCGAMQRCRAASDELPVLLIRSTHSLQLSVVILVQRPISPKRFATYPQRAISGFSEIPEASRQNVRTGGSCPSTGTRAARQRRAGPEGQGEP